MRPFIALLLLAGLAPLSNAAANPSRFARAIIKRAAPESGAIQPPFGYDPANPGWSQNLIVDPSSSTVSGAPQPSPVAGGTAGDATNGDGAAPKEGDIIGVPNNNPITTSGAAGATATGGAATTTTSGAAATTTSGAAGGATTSLLDAQTQPADPSVPTDLDIPAGAVPPAASGGADGNANGATTTATTSGVAATTTTTAGGNGGAATTTTTTTTQGGGNNGGGATTTPPGQTTTTPGVGNITSGRRFRCRAKVTTQPRAGGEQATTTSCTKTTTTTSCTKTTTTSCTKTTTTSCTKTTKTKKMKKKTKTRNVVEPTGEASFQDVKSQSDAMIQLLTKLQSSLDIKSFISDLKGSTNSNLDFAQVLSNLAATISTKNTISLSDVVQAINDAAGGTDVTAEVITADLTDNLKNGASATDVISLMEQMVDKVKNFSEQDLNVLAQMIEKAQLSNA